MPEKTTLYITLPNGSHVCLEATTLDLLVPDDSDYSETPSLTSEIIQAAKILGKSFDKISTARPVV